MGKNASMFFGPLKYIKRRHFFLQYGSVGPIFFDKIIQSWPSPKFLLFIQLPQVSEIISLLKVCRTNYSRIFRILDCLNILHSYLSNSFLLGFHEFYLFRRQILILNGYTYEV